MIAPDRVAFTESFDGTRICYQVFGEGPPVVIGNGIGVGYRGLRLLIEALRPDHSVVCWDHRGIFESGAPGWGGVSVVAQARDCLTIMETEALVDASYIGWSMGVQVGFELLRMRSHLFKRVASISGVPGRPAQAAVPLPAYDRVMARGLRTLAPVARGLPARALMSSALFFRAATGVGFVREHVVRDVFDEMVQGVASHDHSLYIRTLAEVMRHDARPTVAALPMPLLFIAGERDRMTPARTLRKLADAAPQGEVHIVRDGSHFALIESPDEVNEVLLRFLR